MVADRIAELSEDLAVLAPSHLSWIGLMVELTRQVRGGSEPQIKAEKLAWLRKAATQYLAESDHLDERLGGLDSNLSSWDAKFLAQPFYSSLGEDDDSDRFDPRAWLSARLDKRRWRQLQELLRAHLSAEELDTLVAWGNLILDPRTPLSVEISDAERTAAEGH
jgi:hypothetical protein